MLESPDMIPPGSQLNLYLASTSPRRKELLSLIGLEYHLFSVSVDETPDLGESGVDYVQRVARSKAYAALEKTSGDSLVIAADTAVIGFGDHDEPTIYGKPADEADAAQMLTRLCGRVHDVITAISVLRTQDGSYLSDSCTTHVPMRNYTDLEIATYIISGDPMDKAGAYAIQHTAFHPVDHLHGCYANVMGLPLCHLARSLVQFGLSPQADVARACQATLGYNCPVYQKILPVKTPVAAIT